MNRAGLKVALVTALWLGATALACAAAAMPAQQELAQNAAAKTVGTVMAIAGNSITLLTDSGNQVTVVVQDAARLVRIAPGQTDLKNAAPISLQDVQQGDRILVRGKLGEDGKSVMATSIIAIKKSDIAEKQAREREEWRKHGVGGLVSAIDSAANTITITKVVSGGKKDVAIHFSNDTVLRRYAPDSVKFDDAKSAPFGQIQPGDQLRARGVLSGDGGELTADEIVSGSFRNIAGTIAAIDLAAGRISVMDLVTKKSVTVKITAESQLRKLPQPMAQRIAAQWMGVSADASTATPPATDSAAKSAGQAAGEPGGMARGGAAPDLQQILSRMPAAALSDLQKGEAVMIVATQGTEAGGATVITLLSGVESILQAAPKDAAATILSPWSLGTGGGEPATP